MQAVSSRTVDLRGALRDSQVKPVEEVATFKRVRQVRRQPAAAQTIPISQSGTSSCRRGPRTYRSVRRGITVTRAGSAGYASVRCCGYRHL